MSKTYKVHEEFDLEHLSWDEENCHCDAPGKKYEYMITESTIINICIILKILHINFLILFRFCR